MQLYQTKKICNCCNGLPQLAQVHIINDLQNPFLAKPKCTTNNMESLQKCVIIKFLILKKLSVVFLLNLLLYLKFSNVF